MPVWIARTLVDVGQQGAGKLRQMFTVRAHHRLTAWLAALAVLWGCLLPVMSHAVVAQQVGDKSWVEVCTATGMAWVKSADAGLASAAGSPQGDTGSGISLATCDWCATHSPLAGLPTVLQPLAAPLTVGTDVPAAFLHAPRPLFVWAAAHSRAPPVSA